MKKTLVNIKKIKNRQEIFCEDTVALETEYSLFVNGQKLVRLSCTPEDLKELALGRLYTEGLVRNIRQIRSIQIQEEERTIYVEISENEKQRTEKESGKNTKNEVESSIESREKEPGKTEPIQYRNAETTMPERKQRSEGNRIVGFSEIFSAAEVFFSQPGELFRETGCAHSCAFWKEREIVCSFEDIGRHNALDKVAGKLLIQEIDPGDGVIFTSGRISADYLKKIIQMGVATVVSRAAVTEAAVHLAEKYGILLLGFVRNHTGNLYAGQL
ncbi:MAG: formate dehydrogenase accessory sulfurtransferase FdhD [Lachnospiraceae bacterium]|nr:formate dehydrogenase accessory sulfurtransferase FdhD [Lachnospiraceae bacterium]